MPKTDAQFDPTLYATVADRIQLFYERYPSGRIVTELVSRQDGETVFRALAFRDDSDPHPAATGWAAEREDDGDVNAVACLENTETSAIGRALANLGFTASSRRPSREEMAKADRTRRRLSLAGATATATTNADDAALQARANATHDLLELVALAERRGLSRRRAAVMRARLGHATPMPLPRVRRLELRLRVWLRAHRM
jgi:hypothetical protein